LKIYIICYGQVSITLIICFGGTKKDVIMNSKSTKNQLLINAVHAKDEVRFALVYNNTLENLYIDKPGSQKKGNIYKARVIRLEPSLQAAFVDYGAERHGFLPFKEIAEAVYHEKAKNISSNNLTISDVLEENQELLIQIDKEERGTKGAALTTQITLAGSYLVLMPNNPKAGGISRRIEGDERNELRDIIQNLQAPEGMGLIVRTAGVGKSQAELQWDLDILLRLWNAIQNAIKERNSPTLIHQESDIISRAIRDYLRKDITEIVVDNPEAYNQCKDYVAQIRPEFIECLTLYNKPTPLFTHYKVESQIETAFQSHVRLPSGGSLVIQQTEALVSIDVNSARDTKGGNIEQTAFNTNREAAIEIARQLRLRDLGGLIVADFIDMVEAEHQREIVHTFQNEVQIDKARVQFGRISKFGLLEISRQRLRPSLSEYTQIICPRCEGLGNIRSVESLSFLILRLVTEHAMNKVTAEINVQVPNNVAAYLCNEQRRVLETLETSHSVKIYIIPNPYYELPQYQIDTVKASSISQSSKNPSYEKISIPEDKIEFPRATDNTIDTPAVNILPLERPTHLTEKPKSLIKRLSQLLFGAEQNQQQPAKIEEDTPPQNKPKRQRHQQNKRQTHSRQTNKSAQSQATPSTEKHHPNRKTPAQKKQPSKAVNPKRGSNKTTVDVPIAVDIIEENVVNKRSQTTNTSHSVSENVNVVKTPTIEPAEKVNHADTPSFTDNPPKNHVIMIETGSGENETVQIDLTHSKHVVINAESSTVDAETQAEKLAKRRKAQAKQYAEQQNKQKVHRRRKSMAGDPVAKNQAAQSSDKKEPLVFVVDEEKS